MKKLAFHFCMLLILFPWALQTYAATAEVVVTIDEIWGNSPDKSYSPLQGGGWLKLESPTSFTGTTCNADWVYIKSSANMQMSVALLAYSQGKQIRVRVDDSLPKAFTYCQAASLWMFN